MIQKYILGLENRTKNYKQKVEMNSYLFVGKHFHKSSFNKELTI